MPVIRVAANVIAFPVLLLLRAGLLSAAGGVGPFELAILALLDIALLVAVNRRLARRTGGAQPA